MPEGIMNKDQLLSLTLRQLRQEASKLSVPLYSRKTKAVLVDLILKYQEKSSKKTKISLSEPEFEENFESNTLNSSKEIKTNVLFVGLGKTFQVWEPTNFEKFKDIARKRAFKNRSNLKWVNKQKGE